MPDFIHLHNHSHFSLQDAACTIKSIVKAAKKFDMKAVALTDHGVMYGIREFYSKCKDESVKPILGMEAYITLEGSRLDRGVKIDGTQRQKPYRHIILIAKNKQGYSNLTKLSSIGFTEGYYYRPRIDLETLEQHSEGIICTSACLGGVVNPFLINGDYKIAKKWAQYFQGLFGDDFYLEVQNHNLVEDKIIMEQIPKLAAELGIKLVGTNDCHYINKEDSIPHNVLLMLGDKSGAADYKNLRYKVSEFHFKSQDEMSKIFEKIPEAISNTFEIADKCDIDFEKNVYYFPKFPLPETFNSNNLDDYFEFLSRKRLIEKFGEECSDEIKERFEYELKTIKDMGFAGYFLIVQDFIEAAEAMGVRVGPGRGSAAGSLIAFLLGITKINPLEYGLLFERFLNPSRNTMPDIDVDFSDDGRAAVIDYVKQKYGEKAVCQIITFNRLTTKAVIKDVGRVLGIPLNIVNNINKHIPSVFGKVYSIEKALSEVPELKWINDSKDEQITSLVKYAKTLEDMNRNASKHAAGVVIAPGDVSNYVPLASLSATENQIVTQYSMKQLEEAGLLKMDFLGLRTLSIIDDTLKFVKQNRPESEWVEDIDKIPLDDEKTYKLFGNGQTTGIFQFESPAMRKYLKKLKPKSVSELAAMNALYRPGPMDFIDDFIDRKFGRAEITYLHPELEPILKETYGIIVYQEQVIKIANQLAGMSLAEADNLRRAMGKKDTLTMEKSKISFVDKSGKRGISEKVATEIFEMILKFANYGFNKSHAVAYSYLAYQTAFLKANFLEEFLASNMTHEFQNQVKVALFLEDCRKSGVLVLPPDVNNPSVFFSVEKKRIRFGLSAIKNVGISAVNKIIEVKNKLDRNFKSIFDFASEVDLKIVNKRTFEGLILSGAFDSLHPNRKSLFESVQEIISYGHTIHELRMDASDSLFGNIDPTESVMLPELKMVEDWTIEEKLSKEREVTGFYITDHPMRKYRLEERSFTNIDLTEPEKIKDTENLTICGVITDLDLKLDKKSKTMAKFYLNNSLGVFECMMFASNYEKFSMFVEADKPVFIKGKLETSGDAFKIMVEEVVPIDEARDKLTNSLYIFIDPDLLSFNQLAEVHSVLSRNPGDVVVFMEVSNAGKNGYKNRILRLENKIKLNTQLINGLANIVGEENFVLHQ
ncbi:MAG: DNA polymerase III subunit alpha [Ignavibacteriaceae bacterium]|nr:DNA polymerase III subunit alpha [Ignavibacteriaceae bacterium]